MRREPPPPLGALPLTWHPDYVVVFGVHACARCGRELVRGERFKFQRFRARMRPGVTLYRVKLYHVECPR